MNMKRTLNNLLWLLKPNTSEYEQLLSQAERLSSHPLQNAYLEDLL